MYVCGHASDRFRLCGYEVWNAEFADSDRLLWIDRTHSRMMRGSSCSAFVAQIIGVVFGLMSETGACWKRDKTSDVRVTLSDPRNHDLAEHHCNFDDSILQGRGAGYLEQRCLQWRVP